MSKDIKAVQVNNTSIFNPFPKPDEEVFNEEKLTLEDHVLAKKMVDDYSHAGFPIEIFYYVMLYAKEAMNYTTGSHKFAKDAKNKKESELKLLEELKRKNPHYKNMEIDYGPDSIQCLPDNTAIKLETKFLYKRLIELGVGNDQAKYIIGEVYLAYNVCLKKSEPILSESEFSKKPDSRSWKKYLADKIDAFLE